MKKSKNKKLSNQSRTPEQRARLVALWIFNIFLVLTVGLIGYGLWVSFA